MELTLVVLCLLGAGFCIWKFFKSAGQTIGATPSLAIEPAPIQVEPSRPGGQIPIQTSQSLLEGTGAMTSVEQIRTLLGFSPANWQEDVMTVIHRFAEFVQLLPASESHHHAQPGGLLIHTLEVAANALKLRQGYKLPIQASVEDQIRLAAVWSYAILVAAILHDLGKSLSDVVVQLYGANPAAPLKKWNGLTGSMLAQPESTHYSVDFPMKKSYPLHAKLSVTLLQSMIPSKALIWLGSSDEALMNELVQYLGGDESTHEGVIAKIVSQADSMSVANNLLHGSRVRFSSSRTPPLIERLMDGLRALLIEGLVAFNRPGATVFVDHDGEHLWLVAGTAANKVRELLNERESRLGQSLGLPTDNARLFDTWSEYGALALPPPEFGKGSVWWVKVSFEGWEEILTMLKFPINKLYPAGQLPPTPNVPMTLTPVSPEERKAKPGATHQSQSQPSDQLSEPSVPNEEADSEEPPPISTDPTDDSNVSETPLEPTDSPYALPTVSNQANQEQELTPESGEETSLSPSYPEEPAPYLDEKDSAAAALEPVKPTATSSGAVRPHTATQAPKALFKPAGATAPRPNAEAFAQWLKEGLSADPNTDEGALIFNKAGAMVHFVDEGMILVTPAIFKAFLQKHPFIGDVGSSKDPLRALQNEINKAGYFARASGSSSFHRYQTKNEDGQLGTPFNVCLIPNTSAYVRPIPASNPLLVKVAFLKVSKKPTPATP